jgi:hypothetical protein
MTRSHTGRMVVAVFALAFVLALLIVDSINAHTSYAGHTAKYWTVTSPTSGATIKYRERLVSQAGCTNHQHDYLTEYYKCGTYGCVWADIHLHVRGYACHAV